MRPLFVLLFTGLCVFVATAFAETTTDGSKSNASFVGDFPTEIAVSGDAPYAEAPNRASFLLRVSQTSASASDATKSLDQNIEKLLGLLRGIDPNIQSRLRNEHYKTDDATRTIKAGPISITRSMQITTSELTKLSALVDTSIQQPGATVEDVRLLVESSGQALLEAIQTATAHGKEKAEFAAKKLGVGLGPLISAVFTEEPEGELIRQRLQQGGDALDFGDKELRVYVTLRYAVQKP